MFKRQLLVLLLLTAYLCAAGCKQSYSADPLPLTVVGHVFNKSGQPIAGATLCVYNTLDAQVASAATDTTGAFQVQIPSGQVLGYTCTVEAVGYGIGGGTIKAQDDNIYRLDAPLTLMGQVVDPAGKPASAASVRLVSVRLPFGAPFQLPEDSKIASRNTATSDANCNYSIAGAPRCADCRVELADPRFVNWTGQAFGGDSTVPWLEAHPCAVPRERVLHADGTPAGDVVVSASCETLDYSWSWYATAKTSSDGVYRITGLPAGR